MDQACHLPLPDGVTLGYRRWRAVHNPERRTLVLLHGLASNHTRWAEFTEQTALRESWNILRPDLRGHGESPTQGKINLEIWCDDLLHLLDTEGVDRAVIAGHSLGAQVACRFAARYLAQVTGLVLVDPAHRPALRGWLSLARRLTWLLRLAIGILRLLNRLGLGQRHFPLRDLRALDETTRAATRGKSCTATPRRGRIYSIFRWRTICKSWSRSRARCHPRQTCARRCWCCSRTESPSPTRRQCVLGH